MSQVFNPIEIPRVSDILKLLYPHALDYVPGSALETGVRLHAYMERWGRDLDEPEKWENIQAYNGKDQLRLLAARKWVLDNDIVPLHIEVETISPLGYRGHPDLISNWQTKKWVLDWKFAEVITAANRIQGEVYRRLVGNCRVALVQIKGSGSIMIHKLQPRADLWAIFLNALAVWKFRQRTNNN